MFCNMWKVYFRTLSRITIKLIFGKWWSATGLLHLCHRMARYCSTSRIGPTYLTVNRNVVNITFLSCPVEFDAHIQRMTDTVPRLMPSFFWLSSCPLCATCLCHINCFMPHTEVCDVWLPYLWLVRRQMASFHCRGSLKGGRCWIVGSLQNLNLKCTDFVDSKLNILVIYPSAGISRRLVHYNFGKFWKQHLYSKFC